MAENVLGDYHLPAGWNQRHHELRAAFEPWVEGVYPEAKTIGEVVMFEALDHAIYDTPEGTA